MAIAVAVVLTPGNPWAITFLDGAIAQAAVAGFASGVVATGNAKGGIQGAISAVIFYGAGRFADGLAGTENLKNGVGPLANEGIGRAAFHAAAGCLNASVSGGDCGRGATTSGLAKLLSANIEVGEGIEANTVKYAVIGGTISVIGGGKFANWAVTGAFQYLFNQAVSRSQLRTILGGERNLQALEASLPSFGSVDAAAGTGYGANAQILLFGGSIDGQMVLDSTGRMCMAVTACANFGMGIGVTVGPSVSFQNSVLQPGIQMGAGLTWFGGAGRRKWTSDFDGKA